MAPRRRFARRGAVGSARRETSWGLGPNGFLNGVSADSVNLFSVTTVPVSDGLTLVRTRGELVMSASGTSGDSAQIAVGLAVVSAEASAIGVTAIPSPITDLAWDEWFFHQFLSINMVSQNANNQSQNYRFLIDSKAMRKFTPGNAMVGIMELANEQGTGVTVDLQLSTRMLFKLS